MRIKTTPTKFAHRFFARENIGTPFEPFEAAETQRDAGEQHRDKTTADVVFEPLLEKRMTNLYTIHVSSLVNSQHR